MNNSVLLLWEPLKKKITTTNNEGRMCLQSHRRVMLNNMKNAMCRLSWEIRSYSISHPITRRCLACLKINAKKYIFNISFVCASPENKMKQKKKAEWESKRARDHSFRKFFILLSILSCNMSINSFCPGVEWKSRVHADGFISSREAHEIF